MKTFEFFRCYWSSSCLNATVTRHSCFVFQSGNSAITRNKIDLLNFIFNCAKHSYLLSNREICFGNVNLVWNWMLRQHMKKSHLEVSVPLMVFNWQFQWYKLTNWILMSFDVEFEALLKVYANKRNALIGLKTSEGYCFRTFQFAVLIFAVFLQD